MTAARRVVLVYKSLLLPPSETFILEQARNCTTWRPVFVGESSFDGGLPLGDIRVHYLSVGNRYLATLRRWFNLLCGRASIQSVRLLRTEHASLVHAHFGTDAVKVWPLVRALRVPMVVTLHGFDINIRAEWWHEGHGGRWMRSYPSRLLGLAKQPQVNFIAVSNAIKKRAIEFGIPEHKITVSYIGIDIEKFRPSGMQFCERHSVLFVGRLVEKKGCQYLLKAFANVQHKFPKAELLIVGAGPEETKLRDMANTLAVRARFLGLQNSRRVSELMSTARIFCLPSVTAQSGDAEGFGLVLLEAQASGVPVITSALGGAAEGVVDRETGFAHAEGDVDALTVALEQLLSNDELSERFGNAARQLTLSKFDIRQCTRHLETIYDQCAK